jgi:hypothetical protein
MNCCSRRVERANKNNKKRQVKRSVSQRTTRYNIVSGEKGEGEGGQRYLKKKCQEQRKQWVEKAKMVRENASIVDKRRREKKTRMNA